jgi:hypothetical protein
MTKTSTPECFQQKLIYRLENSLHMFLSITECTSVLTESAFAAFAIGSQMHYTSRQDMIATRHMRITRKKERKTLEADKIAWWQEELWMADTSTTCPSDHD